MAPKHLIFHKLGKLLFVVINFFGLASCGISDFNQYYFEVKMMGVYAAPEGSTAPQDDSHYEPVSQTYELQGIYLSGAHNGTTEDVTLYDSATDPENNEFRIINRVQLVFKKKIPDSLFGYEATSLRIAFKNKFMGDGRFSKNQQVLLDDMLLDNDNFEVVYENAFTIGSGLNQIVLASVKWKNTVAKNSDGVTDTMSAPQIVLSISNK